MNATKNSKAFLVPLAASLSLLGSCYLVKTAHATRLERVDSIAAFTTETAPAAPNHTSPPIGATHPSATTQAAAAVAVSVPSFAGIADQTMPSVVNIFTTKNVRSRMSRGFPGPDSFWDGFFSDGDRDYAEQAAPPTTERPASLGSGFVIEAFDGGGLIVTNNHVVAGADGIKVKFTEANDERESPAEIIGADPELDVALLKVKTSRKLTPILIGDSDKLRVGEWIAAIGNPFGHGHSLTHGVVSAKERSLPGAFGKYLQVDAPINPGNSGGPLVNVAGEVIGINNAIDARGPGIGFAIPINSVRAALPALKERGRVERGYLGIAVAPRPDDGAAMVAQIMENQPADIAGLKNRDIIRELDGKTIHSPDELVAAVVALPVGKTVRAGIERGGRKLSVDLRVGRRPSPRFADRS